MSRKTIIRPGQPNQPTKSPSSPPGSYQDGAVRLGKFASLFGSGALNGDGSGIIQGSFTKGVISFWARYKIGGSPSGTSTVIGQIRGSPSDIPPSKTWSICTGNDPTGLANDLFTVGIFFGPTSIDLYLTDVSGTGLLFASMFLDSPPSDVSPQWFNYGPFAALLHPAGSTFNGTSNPDDFIMVPCGGILAINNGVKIWQKAAPPPPNPYPTERDLGTVLISGSDFQNPWTNPTGMTVWSIQNESIYHPTQSSGWHHYICSWDASQLVLDQNGEPCIRAQWARDRGGGPIAGGGVMDTAATGIGTIQPMSNWATQAGVAGTLKCSRDDVWAFTAPLDDTVDLAYCYMGVVPAGKGFFDLTAARHSGGINLDYFISPGLSPVNLGFQGQNVPLFCNWMHTGSATTIDNFVQAFSLNAADFKNWRIIVSPMTSTDGPPLGA